MKMPTVKTLAVKPVRNGLGIVAAKTFRRGAIICEIKGKIVSAETVWRYWETDPRLGENCFRFDDDNYLDPNGEIGQYANHSCSPNTGIVKKGRRLFLKAISPIAPGEEITHDYATLLGTDDVWKMRCNCGAAHCRRRVRNIGALPTAVIKKYRRLGVVPDFIYATL
jgi:SET domain-containing protein